MRVSFCFKTCVVIGLTLACATAACSDGPTAVTPLPPISPPAPPPPPPPPPNTPPVIGLLTVSTGRTEIDTPVEVVAEVTDAESEAGALAFEWSADGGTFTGAGPRVSWRPPAAPTPATYQITLTVAEAYSALDDAGQIVMKEHRIASGPIAVRVHDSPTELGDMGLRFLGFFTDSSLSPEACLVDFSDNCRGKAGEFEDIEDNRAHYEILDASFGPPRISYTAGATAAEVLIETRITSRIINCSGIPDCTVGSLESAYFDAYLPAVYEADRWWICASNARGLDAVSPAMRRFFGDYGSAPDVPSAERRVR